LEKTSGKEGKQLWLILIPHILLDMLILSQKKEYIQQVWDQSAQQKLLNFGAFFSTFF
jgi:hypothetical protein